MDQFLHEVIGWLGYLQRASVVSQLLLVAVPGLVATTLHRRLPARSPLRPWLRPLALGTIAMGSVLLAQGGYPWRFALSLGMLYLGWQGLALLPDLLGRWLPVAAIRQVDSRLLRPAYLLLVGLTIINWLDSVQDLAAIPVGEWFGVPLTLGRVFMAGLIIYLVIVCSGLPARGMAWLLQRALVMSDGTHRAVAGGLSVGLGFGIKEVFSNFISGLWLLLEGSVRPGDVLFVDGDPCEVRSLGLRAAVLWRDRDNAELVIPNQTFFTATTTTYTGSDRLRRSQISVGASYRHDPRQVMALLEATALATPRVLAQPAPKALLLAYGDSAVEYALRFWIANPMDNVSICSDVNAAVWHTFTEQGIEIPYPQQVVHEA